MLTKDWKAVDSIQFSKAANLIINLLCYLNLN